MCVLNPPLDLDIFPQMAQGCNVPAMWGDSMCFLILFLTSSFPHTLQITGFLFTLSQLRVIMLSPSSIIKSMCSSKVSISAGTVWLILTKCYNHILPSHLFELSWFSFMWVFSTSMCSQVWLQHLQIICITEWRWKAVLLFVAKFQSMYSHLEMAL